MAIIIMYLKENGEYFSSVPENLFMEVIIRLNWEDGYVKMLSRKMVLGGQLNCN